VTAAIFSCSKITHAWGREHEFRLVGILQLRLSRLQQAIHSSFADLLPTSARMDLRAVRTCKGEQKDLPSSILPRN